MRFRGRRDQSVTRVKSLAASGVLLLAALLPAGSLLVFRIDRASDYVPRDPVSRCLFIAFALSTFLLAIFLGRARSHIRVLKTKEAEAIQHAEIDALSGLPNRLALERRLNAALAQATRDEPIALLLIDIDQFKVVNDTYGHQTGDRLIIGIAERIRRVVSAADCLSRIGGDEFALILSEMPGASHCTATAHRILDAMLAPFQIGDMEIYATLSAGVALSPRNGETPSILMAAADLALYRAKNEGRNRFAFFDKTMERQLVLGMRIEDDLRSAIRGEGLMLLYQPQMSGCGTRLCGLEALVRWNHPVLGVVSPEEFIPLAESRGLISQLGEWVLRRACRDARRWPSVRIGVNVSPVQFRNLGFVSMVKDIVDECGLDPERLELELTEGVLIQDADQAETVIIELRALGIRMGLDDFGSGYSSMIYLRRFAFDKIKIDKALLASSETKGEGAIILESIISLGHALGLTVTAEGVEHREQVEFLQKLGCDEMQGFFFSQPLTAEEIDMMISLDGWTEEKAAAVRARLSAA